MDTAEKLTRAEVELGKPSPARVMPRLQQRGVDSGRPLESPQGLYNARLQLAEAVGAFEADIFRLRSQELHGAALSEAVLLILRRIVARETPAAALEEGIGSFFAKLGGGADLEADVRALYAASHAFLQSPREETPSDRGRILQTLQELVSWYGRRAETILLLRHELRPQDEEGLFDVQAYPNARHFGVDGLMVTCRATVAARRRGDAWIKLFVRREGKLIAPAQGWQHWVDDTESFLSPNSTRSARPDGVLCVSVPVVFPAVVTPRAVEIFDRVRLFIPHAALGLAPGVQTLDLEVELTGSRGPIRTESIAVECAVPPSTGSRIPFPAPQALGMWADDLGSGSSIRELQIDRASVGEGWRGASEGVRVRASLKMVGFAGSSITIEYRLLQRDGRAVGLRSVGMQRHIALDPQSDTGSPVEPETGARAPEVISSVQLHPDLAVATFEAIEVRLPISRLELPVGKHPLVLEMTVLDTRGRIVCGTGAPFELLVGDQDEPSTEVVPQFVQVLGGALSHLSLSGVEIQPRSLFAGRNQVRVAVGIDAASWNDALFMVEVLLRTAEGAGDRSAPQVTQRIWVHGADEPRRRVVANFDYAEILARLPVDTQREYRFEVLVRLRDNVERIIAERSEPFSWSAPVAAVTMPEPQDSKAPVVVVDLQSERLADGNQAVCSVAMNVNPRFRDGDQAVLYYEVLDGAERPLAVSESRHGLPGSIVRVDLAEVRKFAARVPGAMQITAQLQFPLETAGDDMRFGRTLRLMLLNAQGALLQVIHHAIVAADSELVRRQEMLQLSHVAADELAAAAPAQPKGIWQRVLGFLR